VVLSFKEYPEETSRGRKVHLYSRSRLNPGVQITTLLLATVLSVPAYAYDYPLSPEAIREAYFLGTRQTSLGTDFLAQYTRDVPLKAGAFTSSVKIETPFSQVALHASRTLGYNAQDAVRDFFDKPALFRIRLDICYKTDAPVNGIKIKVMQNKKEIVADSLDSSPYYPATDKRTHLPSIGEQLRLEFRAEKIDSSPLTILIDTPDGQHAETEFALQTLR
jgi:hypothetical protein